MNNTTTRIPRPRGTTLLAHASTNQNTIAHILSHYIDNGFTYLGIRMSIQELCHYTNISEDQAQKGIVEASGVYARMFNPDGIQATMRALLGTAFAGALGDKARIALFLERLEGQLADNQNIGTTLKIGYLYQKMLDTQLRSTNSFSQLATTILPKGPAVNILLGFEADPSKGNASSNYIGRDEALKLINESNRDPLLLEEQSSPRALALFQKHNLGNIESIIANPQDDGEIVMGNLQKASEIILKDLYDEDGHLID